MSLNIYYYDNSGRKYISDCHKITKIEWNHSEEEYNSIIHKMNSHKSVLMIHISDYYYNVHQSRFIELLENNNLRLNVFLIFVSGADEIDHDRCFDNISDKYEKIKKNNDLINNHIDFIRVSQSEPAIMKLGSYLDYLSKTEATINILPINDYIKLITNKLYEAVFDYYDSGELSFIKYLNKIIELRVMKKQEGSIFIGEYIKRLWDCYRTGDEPDNGLLEKVLVQIKKMKINKEPDIGIIESEKERLRHVMLNSIEIKIGRLSSQNGDKQIQRPKKICDTIVSFLFDFNNLCERIIPECKYQLTANGKLLQKSIVTNCKEVQNILSNHSYIDHIKVSQYFKLIMDSFREISKEIEKK